MISSAAWPRANYGFARIAQLCEPITPTTCSETRARPSAQTKSALEGGACERQQKLNEASELVEASKLFAEADARRVSPLASRTMKPAGGSTLRNRCPPVSAIRA